jgi:hypothetical protein
MLAASSVTGITINAGANDIINLQGLDIDGAGAVMVGKSTIANNGVSLEAQNSGALLQVSGSAVTGNATGWLAVKGGQVISARNNGIGGNVTGNTAPPTAVVSPTPTPTPTTNYLVDNNGVDLVDSSGARLTAS